MLRKNLFTAIAVLAVCNVKAQDSTKTLTVTGSLDAYYRYNFSGKMNNYTSFTNSQNSFELGMASVKLEGTALKGKVGATVDIGYGRRAEEFSYNDGEAAAGKNGFASLSVLKQVFVTYSPSSTIKITAGKFATHVGYELLDAGLNRNYSMGYMFTNGPFFHTGIKADITAGPVAFMVGVSNYNDETTTTTAAKSLIAQFSGGTKNEKLKFYLNYAGFFGPDSSLNPNELNKLNQIDLVVTGKISKKFNIAYNGTVQSRKLQTGLKGTWWGSALYFNYDPSEKAGLTLRSEIIEDNSLIYFGTKSIFANTFSVNYKIGPLTIIPELRFENSKTNIYTKKDGNGASSTMSALLAAVYKF